MKILGIGNAIVDVICKVEDDFITKNGLTKSTMKLIFDENKFKNLLSNLKIEKTVSGGSVANSIVGLSQLGNEVGFIGKVCDDELGSKYEDGLKKENVKYNIGKFPFLANSRAKVNNETEGFVKIIADEKTDKVLGVSMISVIAGTLIAELALAMEFGASSEDIARTCHAHPTYSEAIKEAALTVDKRAIHS